MKDYIVKDFTDPRFQDSFKEYFKELEIEFEDWEDLFRQMNEEKDNIAIVRVDAEETVGFIQFKIDYLENWFFKEEIGFIREFWVSSKYRNKRQGASLLKSAEDYFLEKKIYKTILTTYTASNFYIKQGYRKDESYKGLNNQDVFVKILK